MNETEYKARQEQRLARINKKIELKALNVCYREAYAEAKAAGATAEDAGEFAFSSQLQLRAELQESSPR